VPRTIELRSGTWSWRVMDDEERQRPDRAAAENGPRPEASLLVLEDPEVRENRMQVRIPRHLGEPGNDAAVEALARHPDRRELLTRDGSRFTFLRRAGQDGPRGSSPHVPREIEVQREGKGPVVVLLPENRGLGEVTGEELLDLIG